MMLKKILFAALLCTAVLFGCSRQSGTEKNVNTVKVFTSVLPQKYFVERIGGDKVSVNVLVQPGKSPATYEPTPSQVIELSGADIFFSIGVPFENNFLKSIKNNLGNIRIKNTSDGVIKRKIKKHFHEEESSSHHEQKEGDTHDSDAHDSDAHDSDTHDSDAEQGENTTGDDPHIWLSLKAAVILAENIYTVLAETDPENSSFYKKNFEELKMELAAAESEIRKMLLPYSGKSFFVFHPSFGYFADEFGLEQIAVESGGKEPSPASLEKIIKEARSGGIKVIIAQPEFSRKSAEVIADAIGGKVLLLNPLDPDYFDTIKKIAEGIKEAFES